MVTFPTVMTLKIMLCLRVLVISIVFGSFHYLNLSIKCNYKYHVLIFLHVCDACLFCNRASMLFTFFVTSDLKTSILAEIIYIFVIMVVSLNIKPLQFVEQHCNLRIFYIDVSTFCLIYFSVRRQIQDCLLFL